MTANTHRGYDRKLIHDVESNECMKWYEEGKLTYTQHLQHTQQAETVKHNTLMLSICMGSETRLFAVGFECTICEINFKEKSHTLSFCALLDSCQTLVSVVDSAHQILGSSCGFSVARAKAFKMMVQPRQQTMLFGTILRSLLVWSGVAT